MARRLRRACEWRARECKRRAGGWPVATLRARARADSSPSARGALGPSLGRTRLGRSALEPAQHLERAQAFEALEVHAKEILDHAQQLAHARQLHELPGLEQRT